MSDKIEIQYTGEPPTRAISDDAGLDLNAANAVVIEPGQWADVPIATRVKAPEGFWLWLTARSSTFRKRGLVVQDGVIDTGYTGPLFATCRNVSDQRVRIEAGDRIAQIVLMPNLTMDTILTEVTDLPETARGSNGFGSSGL